MKVIKFIKFLFFSVGVIITLITGLVLVVYEGEVSDKLLNFVGLLAVIQVVCMAIIITVLSPGYLDTLKNLEQKEKQLDEDNLEARFIIEALKRLAIRQLGVTHRHLTLQVNKLKKNNWKP